MKLDDHEEYEEWEQEGEEEGEEALKPTVKVLVFLGMVVMAAIICAVLWSMTHGNKFIDNSAVDQTEESETISGEDTEAIPEGSLEPVSETVPEKDPESASAAEPEENPEPGSGSAEASVEEHEAPASDVTDNSELEQNIENGTMTFAECQDTVMPKEVINLRSAPSTAQADNIVTQAANGELLTRTGINTDTGWSRVEYNGQTLYAVSSYLTTDLSYQPPVAQPDPNVVNTKDGRTITFTDCDDNITPKIYVNLRLEPSTSEGNDTVHCRLEYGEIVHRTGISEASGWSRVEYDGYVLYVVTSYMYVVEEQ